MDTFVVGILVALAVIVLISAIRIVKEWERGDIFNFMLLVRAYHSRSLRNTCVYS